MSFNYLSDNHDSKWTDDEKRKLIKLAGTMSLGDLGKKFTGKTIKAIKGQCHRLGIKYGFFRKRT